MKVWPLLLVRPQSGEIRLLFRNWDTCLKFGPSHSPLSGSAIDDLPTFSRNFYKKGCVGRRPHPTLEQARVAVGQLMAGHLVIRVCR